MDLQQLEPIPFTTRYHAWLDGAPRAPRSVPARILNGLVWTVAAGGIVGGFASAFYMVGEILSGILSVVFRESGGGHTSLLSFAGWPAGIAGAIGFIAGLVMKSEKPHPDIEKVCKAHADEITIIRTQVDEFNRGLDNLKQAERKLRELPLDARLETDVAVLAARRTEIAVLADALLSKLGAPEPQPTTAQ